MGLINQVKLTLLRLSIFQRIAITMETIIAAIEPATSAFAARVPNKFK